MSHRILVIDDEPHVVQVMKTFLSRADFVVDIAPNGEQGLELVRAHRPDAVITDFEMPCMNGRDLVERLLAEPGTRPALIILMTSRTDPTLREWVDRMDGVDFVEKPASPRRLVRFIQSRLAVPRLRAVS